MTLLTPRQIEENRLFPGSEYLISIPHKLLICAIPKNGCTTIKSWFLKAINAPTDTGYDVHAQCRGFYSLNCQPPEVAEKAFGEYYSFVFLRDPFTRIASAFIEKFIGPEQHELFEPAREVIEEVHRMHGARVEIDTTAQVRFPNQSFSIPASSTVAYSRGISFREFVAYLAEAPDGCLDNHWKPQAAFMEGRRFSHAGRIQDLSRTLPLIARRLDLPAPEAAEHNRNADSPGDGAFYGDTLCRELHRRGIKPTAEGLYDDEIRRIVRRRFHRDFELYQAASLSPEAVP